MTRTFSGFGVPLVLLVVGIALGCSEEEPEEAATAGRPAAQQPQATSAPPQPQANGDVAAYAISISANGQVWASSLSEIGRLMSDAGQTPTLLEDPAWRASVDGEIRKLRDHGDQMKEREPPACLADVHETLEASIAEVEAAVVLLEDGLDTGQAAFIEQAGIRMTAGMEAMNRLSPMMEAADCR